MFHPFLIFLLTVLVLSLLSCGRLDRSGQSVNTNFAGRFGGASLVRMLPKAPLKTTDTDRETNEQGDGG